MVTRITLAGLATLMTCFGVLAAQAVPILGGTATIVEWTAIGLLAAVLYYIFAKIIPAERKDRAAERKSLIDSLHNLTEKQDRWETQRAADSAALNAILRDITRHCTTTQAKFGRIIKEVEQAEAEIERET